MHPNQCSSLPPYTADNRSYCACGQGGDCFSFFMQWGLPKAVLKQVWDVVAGDEGQLNPQQFAACLHLMDNAKKVRQQWRRVCTTGCRKTASFWLVCAFHMMDPVVGHVIGETATMWLLAGAEKHCWSHPPALTRDGNTAQRGLPHKCYAIAGYMARALPADTGMVSLPLIVEHNGDCQLGQLPLEHTE